MLRIGEIAELVGVTQRTIRHYHHVGLLPEPARDASGYRSYGMDDVVRLIRVRQLASLGLSLAEVADALADGSADLTEVLTDLDAELARREAEIRRQRETVARLLAGGGEPGLSPEVTAALHELSSAVDPEIIELERNAARLLEHVAPAAWAAGMAGMYGQVAADPDRTARLAALSRRFMDLADDEVEEVAAGFVEELGALLPAPVPDQADDPLGGLLGELMIADFSPAQQRVIRLAAERLQEGPL
ncbi:MerR family transcriptional regulator [Actinomadura hibisca]|uniref:MerR family transcriptional regulator n=1 Tax=Actinomadura hibisca TaxID=68565 RepID=UPI0014708C88|nr:MerR family transcriptional regulator [Actinomadura hibisca]